MGDLAPRILELVARLSRRDPSASALSSPEPAPSPAPAPEASGLSEASVADFAQRGEAVVIRSQVLDGALIYLAPGEANVATLLGEGIPRHRIYLPGELLALRHLFTPKPEAQTEAIRAVDAVREVFGPGCEVVEVVAVRPCGEVPSRRGEDTL